MPPAKVFISYSHDSPEHQDRVRALADRLRADGIDARIDQYAPAPADGWPMWMDEQIRTADFVLLVCTEAYLQRVERRESPGKGRGVLWEAHIIFNSLYPDDADVQKFIPVLYKDCQPSWIPLRLRGLTHYQLDTVDGYEDLYRHLTNQPRYQVPVLGEPKALPTIAPQSYPASLGAKPVPKSPTNLDQRHRQQMIKQVRLDWIQGVLDQSLYKVARLELGLTDRSDFVEQPLNAVVQIPDRSPKVVSPGKPISQIFDEQAGALLILGAPGTGKTTLLLELARDLLDRADSDESQPIPVVFNLSSWAARRQSLNEWLITELNERSYVPKRVARQWIDGEQIVPLLDGLDEVAAPQREVCVDAINSFRREHGLLHIAVCSRIADYQTLGTKLRLRSAVEIQVLTRDDVDAYLKRMGDAMQGLRENLANDPSLSELLETPLMLSVGMLAYRDGDGALASSETLGERRSQLFKSFVDAMFRRKGNRPGFTQNQATLWLSSLACKLTTTAQTVFYLESLDTSWLETRLQRSCASIGIVLSAGLIGGLVSAIVFLVIGTLRGLKRNASSFGLGGWLITGLIYGLIVGLIVGLIGTVVFSSRLKPTERLTFRWASLFAQRGRPLIQAMRNGLVFGLLFGLIIGLLSGLFFTLIDKQRGALTFALIYSLIYGVIVSLIIGLILGPIFGLIFGLTRLFILDVIPEARADINQGTKRSIRLSLLLFFLAGGLVGLTESHDVAVLIGLMVGLFFGGLFVLRHFVVRLFLWRTNCAPLRYVQFLEQAKDLLFLRQVGGGYIFTHRLLRDYFALLPESKREPKERSKAATAS